MKFTSHIKGIYIAWRNKHRPDVFLRHPKDLFQFFVKNLWKGFFDDRYSATFFLGIVFCSCLGFWVEVVKNGFAWSSESLTGQLVTIVPALFGTTIMDTFLWHEQVIKGFPDEPVSLSGKEKRYINVVHALPWVVALLGCSLVFVSFYAFKVHAVGTMYIGLLVTLLIIWCVRAADAKLCFQGNDGGGFSDPEQVTGTKDGVTTSNSSSGQNNLQGCKI